MYIQLITVKVCSTRMLQNHNEKETNESKLLLCYICAVHGSRNNKMKINNQP